MLSSRHFYEFGSPRTWNDLASDKVVVQCKGCKNKGKEKWIWSRWHAEKEWIDECAPCYFHDET